MGSEQVKLSEKKNFLILFAISALFLGGIFFITHHKKLNYSGILGAPKNSSSQVKTEAEKLINSQKEEIDKIRAQEFLKLTTTNQSQFQDVDKARIRIVKQNSPPEATKRTINQQIQELDALRAAVK